METGKRKLPLVEALETQWKLSKKRINCDKYTFAYIKEIPISISKLFGLRCYHATTTCATQCMSYFSFIFVILQHIMLSMYITICNFVCTCSSFLHQKNVVKCFRECERDGTETVHSFWPDRWDNVSFKWLDCDSNRISTIFSISSSLDFWWSRVEMVSKPVQNTIYKMCEKSRT